MGGSGTLPLVSIGVKFTIGETSIPTDLEYWTD